MDADADGNGVCFAIAYDVLLDILRRLPCRALAESRRVCRAWRDAVDAHNLLLPHFFPRGIFPGIFTLNYGSDDNSSFFAPLAPRSGKPLGADDGPVFRHPVFRYDWASVLHYCNGLLLLEDEEFHRYVCNPATVRCAHLPVPPVKYHYPMAMFLAFDPAVSLHYEVFLLPKGKKQTDAGQFDASPPSRSDVIAEELRPSEKQQDIHVHVPGDVESQDKVISILLFSSQTGQWASRDFVPRRSAPRHLYGMVSGPHPHPRGVKMWKTAEYWQGSLYVHCWNNFIMILRNSEGAYDLAQLPGKAYDDSKYGGMSELPKRSILVSYEKGVHYVALDTFQLHVWTLVESDDGQVEWMLGHEADLSLYNPKVQQLIKPRALWEAVENNKSMVSLFEPRSIEETVYDEEDGHSNTSCGDDDEGTHEVDALDGTLVVDAGIANDGHGEGEPYEDDHDELKSEDGFVYSWDSDEDNFIDLDESVTHQGDLEYGSYRIIGLHPHKDVVLLETYGGVVAYHFRTSRMQYLGWHLVRNAQQNAHGIDAAFPYRPCYVDALLATKLPYSDW